MRVKVLSSSVEGAPHQFAASYVIDDFLCLDAGSLGFSDIERQQQVRHVLLTHSHLDHVASLPIFIDNVYECGPDCPTIYAGEQVIETLRTNFFNELVWPDLDRLSSEDSPFVDFEILKHRRPLAIEGITVTPVELDHVVPTFGFVVDDGVTAVGFVSDTGPTEEIWEVLRAKPNLKAIFLEAAFPNSMSAVAERSKHLTPALFEQEYRKLGREIPVLAIHIKPAFYDEVVEELRALESPTVEISEPNRTYDF